MSTQSFDVIALGELLVDFTENGLSPQGNPLFEANPGGAPCNVLAMLKKLDRSCLFLASAPAAWSGTRTPAPPWPSSRPCPAGTGTSPSTATPART